MALKGMSFCGWGVRAIGNTRPDVWPAEPIDPTQPFKWQTRRVMKAVPLLYAPYQPGDIVYIKEGVYREPVDGIVRYRADDRGVNPLVLWQKENGEPYKVSALSCRYMPRECARYFVRVREVRPERLQDMTIADCRAEGIVHCPDTMAHTEFAWAWNPLHHSDGHDWLSNPWVWRYVFERVSKEEAEECTQ